MGKFIVTLTETFEIDAASQADAEARVIQKYGNVDSVSRLIDVQKVSRELLVDYTDPEWGDRSFAEIIADIRDRFGLNTDYVACHMRNNLSYSNAESFDVVHASVLYEWIDDKIQCADCKNGCQVYRDLEDKDAIYLCITGSNYYDKETDKYKGTDEIHLSFKNFMWNKL